MSAVGGVPGPETKSVQPEVLAAIRALLDTQRVLSLAVLVDGEPEAGLLPYAVREDFGAVYLQASGLARHARGLRPGGHVGLLVHASESPDADPMQLPRLSVQAEVGLLGKGTEAYARAAARFTARFPAAALTLELGDFNLYELTLGRGRYVEGFARAFNVGPDTFGQLNGAPVP
ncbi:MAG: pyridoxamine 5'-phosphate oxidase [Acidobacteriota bacterium]|nr:pyridoxamine 5'-phosphate oxidase [Acidobacteriota bacterium]